MRAAKCIGTGSGATYNSPIIFLYFFDGYSEDGVRAAGRLVHGGGAGGSAIGAFLQPEHGVLGSLDLLLLQTGKLREKRYHHTGYYPINTHSSQNRPYNYGNIFLTKAFFWKIIERETLKRDQTTTLLQIFCELLLYSQVILKNMGVADDTF